MTTNLTLYDDNRHFEEDIYAYEWEDLADGLITNEHASVIKLLTDQMTADDIILLIEPLSGTGKTAKFILDNSPDPDNIPKIVSQDVFQNTFLYCGEFFDIVEDDPRVYQNSLTPDTVEYNMAGEVTGVTKHYANHEDVTIDLTVDPEVRSKTELGKVKDTETTNVNMSLMLNANGDALGNDTDEFVPTLIVSFPFPISLGYPLHEAEGLASGLVSSLSKLPVGGVLMLVDIHYEQVNVQMWRAIDAMKDEHGFSFEFEWLISKLPNGEQSVPKVATIKRTG